MKPIDQDWPQFIESLEANIVAGNHREIKKTFHSLIVSQVPRAYAQILADMAWRISEPLLTLKILNRYITPENPLAVQATDSEKFIYAASLAHLGAIREAQNIYETIDSDKQPEVLLRKALSYFRLWDYQESISLLQKFIAKPVAPYRKLIGQMNLVAALIVENQCASAQNLLSEIRQICEKENYLLLLGNSYELQAQICFFQGKYSESVKAADKAIQLLKNQNGDFSLFAKKWKLICEATVKKDAASLNALKNLKNKAAIENQFETYRECDLFIAVITNDENIIRKVIMGTPFKGYRQRARQLFGKSIILKGDFQWLLGDFNLPQKPFLFNPYQKAESATESLHVKSQLLALFEALTLDFYKASHIGFLFQHIYKDEKFNPFTSPKRVLTLMKRLNHWFTNQNIPLRVRFKKSEFALTTLNNFPVQVLVRRATTLSKQNGNLALLRQHFQHRTFSSQNISSKMNISKTSAQELIQKGLNEGLLLKKGNGRATVYSLVTRVRKRSAA